MTPVRQTIMAVPQAGWVEEEWARDPSWTPGNCVQAAVASLCDLPLEEVPHFANERRPGGGQWWAMRTWARSRGFDLARIYLEDEATYEAFDVFAALDGLHALAASDPWWRYCIVSGYTARGSLHVVVWDLLERRMAHDPHPADAGIEVPYMIEWREPEPYDPDPETQYRNSLAAYVADDEVPQAVRAACQAEIARLGRAAG